MSSACVSTRYTFIYNNKRTIHYNSVQKIFQLTFAVAKSFLSKQIYITVMFLRAPIRIFVMEKIIIKSKFNIQIYCIYSMYDNKYIVKCDYKAKNILNVQLKNSVYSICV